MAYSGRCVAGSICILFIIGVGAGIAIGYFLIPGKDKTTSSPETNSNSAQRFQNQCHERLQLAKTCDPPLPRHYMATRKSGSLSIDGRLDDEAWKGVQWTQDFVDIRGASPLYPAPTKETRVKVIYDDTHIYVATRLTEDQVWATYTQKDSRVYQENAFEIFFDVDNSMACKSTVTSGQIWNQYKEYEINALGTTWDLALTRAYIDGGNFTDWEGISEKGVYTDGGVNDIHNQSTFWSTEVSFSFSDLNMNTNRAHTTPLDGEFWFTIFARPQYQTQANQTTGQYEKVPGSKASWWSWNPTGAVALHLPNRWGLLYFANQTAKEAETNQLKMTFPSWKIYYGLFHIFEVMQEFKTTHGMFVSDENLVHFDPFIHDCFSTFEIKVTNDTNFEAKLASSGAPTDVGHIDQNRCVWFT